MAPTYGIVGFVLAVTYLTFLQSVPAKGVEEVQQQQQPLVSKNLEKLIVLENSSVTLDCVVPEWSKKFVQEQGNETEPLQIIWRKEGEEIFFDSSHNAERRIYQLPNGSLVIQHFKPQPYSGILYTGPDGKASRLAETDVGKYQCAAKGPRGKVVFIPIFVHSAKVPSFSRDGHPKSTSVHIGGVARFRCFVDKETLPPASYSWKFNQGNLPHTSRYTVLPGGILQIANVRFTDLGVYQCIASNRVGNIVSNVASLFLKNETLSTSPHSPLATFKAQPVNVTARTGSDAILECLADGNPSPQVSWLYSNGQQVRFNSKYQRIGLGNLRIANVSAEDAGTYVCRATIPGKSSIMTAATVRVGRGPKMKEHLASVRRSFPSETTRFICVHDESVYPKTKITWLKDGVPLRSTGKTKLLFSDTNLVIYPTTVADTGVYQCVLSNQFGFATSAANLFVDQPLYGPHPPTIWAVDTSRTSITVEWNSDNDNIVGYAVHYFKTEGDVDRSEQLVADPTDAKKILKNLDPFTNYTIYVVAFNNKYGSQHSQQVTVATKDDVPTAAPDFVLQASATIITVSVKELTREKARGEIREYKIFIKEPTDSEPLTSKIRGSLSQYNITGLTPETSYQV